MRIIECQQGTDEWYRIKAGKVSASRLADMLARTKSGWGASRANYAAELVAERLTGQPYADKFKSPAMERGNEVEASARDAYAFLHDADVKQVGFVLHPTIDFAGCSPDGLVGDDGLVQFKCPNTATHIDTLCGGSIDGRYLKQVQWEMACTGRQWCDFVSFDDRLPEPMQMEVRRIPRDPILIAEFEQAVRVFLAEVENTVAALLAKFQ